jgi:hypothetical protein
MATFTFGEANTTTLETIDSKWEGSTTFLAVYSGLLGVNNNGADRPARYENSQPATQSAQALVKAAATWRGPTVKASSGNTLGYNLRIADATTIDLRRGSTFLTDATATGADFTANDYTVKIKFNDATKFVTVWYAAGDVADAEISGTQIINFDDTAGALTSGFPGLRISAAATAVGLLDNWTDFVSDGASAKRGRLAMMGVGR